MPGKDTQTQNQNSVTSPYEPTKPLLQDILNKYGSMNTSVTPGQSSALTNLSTAASGIPNFGNSSSDAIKNLFGSSTAPQVGMLGDAYRTLQGNLGSTASGAGLNPYSTPGFSDAINTMTNDITNQTKGVFAGSGRDPSGAGSFAQSLGRGLTQGIAPTIANQYNQNAARMDAANNTLFGGAGSTATGITGQQQVPLTNAANAVGLLPAAAQAYLAPGTAQLGAANAQFQQPYGNLSALLNPVAGIAGLGGQSSGTSTTTQPQNTLSNILGGALGGTGILSATGAFGPAGWLPALSDERAKDDIEPVGKLNDGQKVYRYKIKGSPKTEIGLLAQEVGRRNPDAVGHIGMGLLGVDYHRATDKAAAMERAA